MEQPDLSYFWKECKKWVEKFSLNDFWWMCEEVDETDSGGWAEVLVDHNTMTAFVRIKSEVFDHENAKIIVDRIAFHEVCEVMLTVFRSNMSDEHREQARHSVLNKIAYALGI